MTSYRLTKEELDQQFEQFLKESVSDESVDLGSSTKHSSVLDNLGKSPQRAAKKSPVSVPWWQEEDSEEAPGRERADKRRFTKVRKSQAVDTQEESKPRESPPLAPSKPTPKPRSKALDQVSQLGQTPRANREPVHSTDGQGSPEHNHPNTSGQTTPTHDHSHNTSGQRSSIHTDSHDAPLQSSDSVSWESRDGLLASGKTFRKSLRKSQPIQEVDEQQPRGRGSEDEEDGEGAEPVLFSRDSLEPEDSVMASGPGPDVAGFGMDTLDEEEEKARFFANLEGGASSTIDFSRLNKELQSTGSTLPTPLRKGEVALTEEDQSKDKDRVQESERISPASPNYSEDFEDEMSGKEDQEKKPERPGMLAKVSLHDSLNSMDGVLPPAVASEEAGSKETETAAPGQSYVQSGGSEMEALQEAYRQISHSVESQSESREHNSSPAVLERARRSVSPTTPEPSRGTLHPASSAGSDLPTAEELMRPIGPDSGFMRGFALQPVGEAELRAEVKVRSSEESPVRTADRDAAVELRGGQTDAPTDSPLHRHRCIAEEVRRLMQEQDDSPHEPSSLTSQVKKGQVPVRSSSSSRTTRIPPIRTKGVESRPSPIATRTPAPSRTSQAAKPPSPLARRKPPSQATNQSPTPAQAHTVKDADSSLRVSSELVASVQSFAAFLQHQMETSSPQHSSPHQDSCNMHHPERTSEPVEGDGDRGEATSSAQRRSNAALPLERLQLQLAQREKELHVREEELRQEHSREVTSLRQESYMLQSKLRVAEEASKKRRWSFGEASDPVTEEKLRLIEREVKEQETLIQGYHQENEKLYLQIKALQAQSKCNEEAMFTENSRLLNELALTKDQLNRTNSQRVAGAVEVPDQSRAVAELLGQVQAAQRSEARLLEDVRRLKQDKQALEVDLEVMRKERDVAKAQVIDSSGDKSFELRLLVEEHKEEVAGLKKRLQWYAENQELLDRDTARLRAAAAETHKLTEQVEKLKMEVGRRASQQQRKVKERAGDAKRIQDLERQIKEMEEILRRRHPNSLPALIYAAASAAGEEVGGGGKPSVPPQPPQTVALLERRIHRLEAELEGRDDDAKRSLRAMEQQYHRIKLQYEQQISDLEQRLAQSGQRDQGGPSEEWESRARCLQEELERLKEAHQERESTLQSERDSLQEQLRQTRSAGEQEKSQRSPTRQQRQAEEAQAVRIDRLSQDLAAKSRSIQELTRTVERLQRERRALLSAPRLDRASADAKRRPAQAKEPASAEKGGAGAETFPPTQDEKDYQPTAFSGSHVSEVLLESERLRARLGRLELQREQERETLQAAATHAQAELQRTQQRCAEQLSSLKADHQRELEHLIARHALEHSSSKVAELTNQVTTQEIMVRHLRDQVKELQGCKDALAVSKLREDTLQNQLGKLLEELKQAKEAHSPELRHFTSLERKIHNMELRYTQRERELQQVIARTRLVVEAEQQSEVERWRRLAQGKSRELEAFRLELDSILDVLRELQRQGVVIPAPEHSTANLTLLPWRT